DVVEDGDDVHVVDGRGDIEGDPRRAGEVHVVGERLTDGPGCRGTERDVGAFSEPFGRRQAGLVVGDSWRLLVGTGCDRHWGVGGVCGWPLRFRAPAAGRVLDCHWWLVDSRVLTGDVPQEP